MTPRRPARGTDAPPGSGMQALQSWEARMGGTCKVGATGLGTMGRRLNVERLRAGTPSSDPSIL